MSEAFYDVIILGTGPAGLQAAIHASRRKVSVLGMGRISKSSAYRAHIENFCCVDGKNGADLIEQARKKAEESGAVYIEEDATSLDQKDGYFSIITEGGKSFRTHTLILAMGISREKLGLENEKSLLGNGVSYCVDCDGGFFKGETVAVTGCQSAAATSALTMLFYAKEVHLVCEQLDVSDYLHQKLKESDVIVHESRKITRIIGKEGLKGIILDDGTRLDVAGLFIQLGAKGALSLAGNLGVEMDRETAKYINTNKKQETNIPGIYAAGDICGPPWQVAKAVGEGCVAGLEAAAYAKKRKKA